MPFWKSQVLFRTFIEKKREKDFRRLLGHPLYALCRTLAGNGFLTELAYGVAFSNRSIRGATRHRAQSQQRKPASRGQWLAGVHSSLHLAQRHGLQSVSSSLCLARVRMSLNAVCRGATLFDQQSSSILSRFSRAFVTSGWLLTHFCSPGCHPRAIETSSGVTGSSS